MLPQPGQQGGQAGDGDGRREQDQAVVDVEAAVPPAEEEPVREAHDDDGGGDEPEDNVDDEERRRGVADGRLACYLCGVSGDYMARQHTLGASGRSIAVVHTDCFGQRARAEQASF